VSFALHVGPEICFRFEHDIALRTEVIRCFFLPVLLSPQVIFPIRFGFARHSAEIAMKVGFHFDKWSFFDRKTSKTHLGHASWIGFCFLLCKQLLFEFSMALSFHVRRKRVDSTATCVAHRTVELLNGIHFLSVLSSAKVRIQGHKTFTIFFAEGAVAFGIPLRKLSGRNNRRCSESEK